ncbi:MAG: serpin family protein [candidate division Zixibacteria bacterium]|nr:serpin family protein [candidate division Zixibacteria bacterium]
MNGKITMAAIGILLMFVPGPALQAQSGRPSNMSKAAANDTLFMERQLNFSFNFISEITKGDFGKNIFVSPLSAMLALAMTYNGASGETRTAMEKVLAFEGLDRAATNKSIQDLTSSMKDSDPTVQLSIANSIWARAGLKFRQDFFDLVRKTYDAELRPLTDAPAINNWVSEKTNDKIKEIVQEVKPDDIMFLINAIYFKGMWKYKFDRANTAERDFYLLNKGSKKIPMMSQEGEFQYYEDGDFQGIRLPYGNDRLAMYIFLPSGDTDFRAFVNDLSAEKWQDWLSRLYLREGEIILPRFKLEYGKNLNDILKLMGMGVAFDPDRADFSAMYNISSEERVFISEVLQKTFVEVNEEGTEAAAVTSVRMEMTSAYGDESQKFRMVVDRPFFCAIRDDRTGAILFTGIIVNPE